MSDKLKNKDIINPLSLDSQLCFPLYVCARKIVNLYTPVLKEIGITYTQYIVFLALWEKDNVTVGKLCERLHLDSGTLSPLIKKLENEGYLSRSRSEKDDRIVLISLTDKGKALKEKVKDVPFKIGSCIDLEPEDAFALYTILNKIMNKKDLSS